MTAVGVRAEVAPEAWERVLDGVRSRVSSFLAARPGLAAVVPRVRAWALWAALAWVLVMVVVFPKYRSGVWTYVCCFWLLVVWFAVARTKTITWAGLARMFAFGVVWSWVIAFVSFRLGAATGVDIRAAGPGTAIAAFTEESLKLAPLAALAVIAPGRVRRFAAVDWLLLGLASGLGFQAWEDLARRVGQDVRPKGLLDLLLQSSSGAPEYGWGLLSGGSALARGDDVYGFAGHHVFTALVAGAIGLAVACWRRPRLRIVAVLLPVLAWFIAVTDHFAYNALSDPNWTDAPHERAPWLIRTAWPLLGHGTGKGWLLLLVLLACLLVDARRLRAAGPLTDLDADGWAARPRLLSERWAPTVRDRLTGSSAKLVAPVQAVVDLVAYAGRDLAVLVTAHLRDGEEPRRAALLRGRAAGVMLREIRAEAIAATLTGNADEGRARRSSRAVAVLTLVVLVLFGTVYALTLARHIGTDLTPPTAWLAGQFDGLAQWWHSLSPLQKVLVGAGVAALIALSGGSLGLAFGASGAFTYVAEHGAGAADFTRDPVGATRSWLATTTPTGALLDLAEFGLTFAPGNFAGAAAGRGIRSVAREYADDPAAFWARRRAALADSERGSIRLPDPHGLGPGDLGALTDYTGPGFREINPALRSGRPLDAAMQARVDGVSRALGKLPDHQGVVFRGTRLTPEQLARYQPGRTVTEEAFTSATADPSRPFRGNAKFVIQSATGKDIAPYSEFPRQAEVLFDRNTTFRVVNRIVDDATGKVTIYMQEVTP